MFGGAFTTSVNAAMGPADKFDLVIKGGDVLDPSQSLRGKTRHRHPLGRDRGDRGGDFQLAAPSKTHPTPPAKLVTPGPDRSALPRLPLRFRRSGFPADELVQFQGTTTVVSAGDAGVNNLAGLAPLYRGAVAAARIYAFVHIAN